MQSTTRAAVIEHTWRWKIALSWAATHPPSLSGSSVQDAYPCFHSLSQVISEHDPRDSAARVFAFAKDMLASSKEVRAGVEWCILPTTCCGSAPQAWMQNSAAPVVILPPRHVCAAHLDGRPHIHPAAAGPDAE